MADELKKKRALAKASFTRTRKNLQEALDKEMISKTVNNRYDSFKQAWNESLKCHQNYLESLNVDEVEEEDKWIEELDKFFNEMEVKTDDYIEKAENAKLEKEKDDERTRLENERKTERAEIEQREIEQVRKLSDARRDRNA